MEDIQQTIAGIQKATQALYSKREFLAGAITHFESLLEIMKGQQSLNAELIELIDTLAASVGVSGPAAKVRKVAKKKPATKSAGVRPAKVTKITSKAPRAPRTPKNGEPSVASLVKEAISSGKNDASSIREFVHSKRPKATPQSISTTIFLGVKSGAFKKEGKAGSYSYKAA